MDVAILGSGGMGETVIRHLRKCERVSRIVAYDLRQDRVKELEAKHGVTGATDLNAVLADPAIPLVFVTASNDGHAPLTLAALEAGKAVMCEKPMATTLDDARAMVETAERLDGFLQIGFELRYSRLYTTVKDWIDQGLLGEVRNTQCSYIASAYPRNSWRIRSSNGDGMFGEKLSHYVDLPRWWIGSSVTQVVSSCVPNVIPYFQIRDNYHTTCRFENGAVSHLTFAMAPAATFRGDPLQDMIDQQTGDGHTLRYLVYGTRGAAETDVFGRSVKRWAFGEDPDRFTSTLVEEHSWSSEQDHVYFHNTLDQSHDIVRRVAEGLPPRTSPQDALETMRVCFAAERSAATGQIINLDPSSEGSAGDEFVPAQAAAANPTAMPSLR